MHKTLSDDQLVLEGHGASFLRKSLHRHVQAGQLKGAADVFRQLDEKEALEVKDFDILKCLHFWLEQEEKIFHQTDDGLALACFLEKRWHDFEQFIARYHVYAPSIISCLRMFVCQKIVKNYLLEYQTQRSENIDLLLKIAHYKVEIGEVNQAIEAMEYARKIFPTDMNIQMKLAYYLCLSEEDEKKTDEVGGQKKENTMRLEDSLSPKKRGLFLFRDAFLHIFPFQWLSFMIKDFLYCVSLMRSMSFGEEEIVSWLPVVAMREGIFDDLPFLIGNVTNVFRMIEKEKTILDDDFHPRHLSAQNVYKMQYFVHAMNVIDPLHFSTTEHFNIYKKKQKKIARRLEMIF